MAISGTINRVKHVRISRDTRNNGDWLIQVPGHAIKALNSSIIGTGIFGGSLFGTSFQHNTSVAVHIVGGGTSNEGTGFGLFIGTGAI